MIRTRRVAVLVAALAMLASLAVAANVSASRSASPIVIGWAHDSTGFMAPFDGPALAAAQIRVKQINAKGGVNGRPLKIVTCDTQGNAPARAKTCALQLIGGGANVIFTTCDVDYATPVVQESINRGLLTIAPCIGTDQMGPKRFGEKKGKLAFSYGNVAQDEGSAMAQYAWNRGWKTAGTGTNTRLVYFQNVVQAFEARFKQLGGKIVVAPDLRDRRRTTSTTLSARLNNAKADVYVTSTSFGELPAFVSGFRSLGNQTPILNSWAGDGTYWLPKSPKVTNYYFVTFASVFGDDPNPARATSSRSRSRRHRRLRRRRRPRSTASPRRSAGEGLDRRRDARGEDGQVQGPADDLRHGQLLAEAAHRVRPPVPRDQDQGQQGEAGRPRQGEGRPEDLVRLAEAGRQRGGPERRSGPPPSRGRSRACWRSRTSRSRCTATRSSG